MPKKLVEQLEDDQRLADDPRVHRIVEKATLNLKGKLDRSEAMRRHAEEELERAESRVDFIRGLDDPQAHDIAYKPRKASGNASAILVLSDWHVEERVDPSTVNGFNEYSPEIAAQRAERMFQKAAAIIDAERGMSKIDDLVVACLGDFITGYIHPELMESNYLSPTQACLLAEELICSGIEFLKKHAGCKHITIPTATGNHGRTTDKQRIATDYSNSFEWLMYKHLEKFYRNDPKVTWKVSNGYHNWLEVQGKPIRFHHGHAFRYQGGVHGASVPIMRKISRWDQQRFAWLDVFGHLHFYLPGEKFVQNGPMIGYGAYGEFAVGGRCMPIQSLIVVDKSQEIPVCVKPIFCASAV
jgi:hypothetical protein